MTLPPTNPPTAVAAVAPFPAAQRPHGVIAAELNEKRALFQIWFAENSEYHRKRNRAIVRRDEFIKEWTAKHPDEPWEPEDLPRGAIVPPPDSPIGVKFHDLHYTIEKLEAELDAARKAISRG